jgi:hypothetical protein
MMRHASGSAARCVRFFYVIATVVFACGASGAHAQTSIDQETRKIEYLLHEVQSLQGAQFVRNGVGYDGNAAADHLRLKWRAAGSRVTTAAEFIRLCATVSSVSGIAYTIRFTDGREIIAEDFFRHKLLDYREPSSGP